MPDTEKLSTEQLLESRPRMDEAEVDTYVSDIYNIGDLDVVQYEKEDAVAVYLESEVLEGLIGYTEKEVLSEVDSFYDSRFNSIDFDTFEYGNGWALVGVKDHTGF